MKRWLKNLFGHRCRWTTDFVNISFQGREYQLIGKPRMYYWCSICGKRTKA